MVTEVSTPHAVKHFDGTPAFFDGGAAGFEDPAHVLAIRRDGETHAKAGAGGERLQQVEVANNQRTAGLDDTTRGEGGWRRPAAGRA